MKSTSQMKPISKQKLSDYKLTVSPIVPASGIKSVPNRPMVPVTPPAIVRPLTETKPKVEVKQIAPQVKPAQKEIKELKPDATSTQLLNLTNTYRKALNLPELKFNPLLSQSAQKRADYIAAHLDQWNHQGTDTSTTTDNYATTILETGYKGWMGENLARDFKDLPSAFTAWQRSKTHNDNLMRAYEDIGLGWAQYRDQKGKIQTIFVQHFGKKQ